MANINSNNTFIYNKYQEYDIFNNILLIDKNIPEYNIFFYSSNSTTFPICYSNNSNINELEELLLLFKNVNRISIIFKDDVKNLFLSNLKIMINLINNNNIKHIDFLANNILNNDNWNNYFYNLKEFTNVIIGILFNNGDLFYYKKSNKYYIAREEIQSIYWNNNIIDYYQVLYGFGVKTLNYNSLNNELSELDKQTTFNLNKIYIYNNDIIISFN